MKLNTTSLAKGESTPAYRVTSFGKVGVAYVGDLDDETLSMECSADQGTSWLPCCPGDDASSQETYTNSQASARPRAFLLPGGIWIRWTMSNGAGTPSGVYVLADGENLTPVA